MLKEILSISGKSGLYKLVSKGKNMFIVESLIDRKRMPVYMSNKMVSLSDISIYADEEEVPLAKVLTKIKEKENGKEIAYNPSTIQPDELRSYLETILPDFDRERVYPSDIKKVISWYNLLIKNGLVDFESGEDSTGKVEKSDENEGAADGGE
ncbi:MAG: DUF5606 domain-containing protein [Dysgonamonadaceae bacterium]|jgi:hypothetical protein|nr:DUF5606 domain-containing protein [Dysgonamonadaceae bacterium]